MTNNYIFFWRPDEENGYFGNWFTSYFELNGIKYNCVEQYMMVQKALLFDDEEIFQKIMKSNSPKTHKSLGRKIKNFDQKIWDQNKEKILYDGLFGKFSQNNDLKKLLLDTNDKILVEASPLDKIYGIGLKRDDKRALDETKWKGENLLGKTMMKVRKDLLSLEN